VRVGAIRDARLADGALTRLRVGAIFNRALGLADVLLPMPLAAANAAVELDNAIFAVGALSVAGRLRALMHGVPTIAVLSRRQYLDPVCANHTSAWIVWLLIALIGAFAGLAVLDTSVMATADRRHQLALVRVIGATRRQARRVISSEAFITIVVGVAIGTLAAPVAVARIPAGRPAWHMVVPPMLFGGILAGAVAPGLLGSLLPARLALRPEPATALGRPE
jgi:putative ABC transport system permease protein